MRFTFFVLLLCAAATALGSQPATFNYQSKLTDSGGAPLQGVHTMFFSIYEGGDANTAGSGALAYSESASVIASNGIVSHAVGTGTTLSTGSLSISTWLASSSYFLEVSVDSPSNVVLPRSSIQPVPFASSAANSELSGANAT